MRSNYQDMYRQQESTKMRQYVQQDQQQQSHQTQQLNNNSSYSAALANTVGQAVSSMGPKGFTGQHRSDQPQSMPSAYTSNMLMQQQQQQQLNHRSNGGSKQPSPHHSMTSTMNGGNSNTGTHGHAAAAAQPPARHAANNNSNTGFTQAQLQQQQQLYSHSMHVSANHSRDNSANSKSIASGSTSQHERKISVHSSKPSANSSISNTATSTLKQQQQYQQQMFDMQQKNSFQMQLQQQQQQMQQQQQSPINNNNPSSSHSIERRPSTSSSSRSTSFSHTQQQQQQQQQQQPQTQNAWAQSHQQNPRLMQNEGSQFVVGQVGQKTPSGSGMMNATSTPPPPSSPIVFSVTPSSSQNSKHQQQQLLLAQQNSHKLHQMNAYNVQNVVDDESPEFPSQLAQFQSDQQQQQQQFINFDEQPRFNNISQQQQQQQQQVNRSYSLSGAIALPPRRDSKTPQVSPTTSALQQQQSKKQHQQLSQQNSRLDHSPNNYHSIGGGESSSSTANSSQQAHAYAAFNATGTSMNSNAGEKKPASFLNYLLLKEIANRNGSSNLSNNASNSSMNNNSLLVAASQINPNHGGTNTPNINGNSIFDNNNNNSNSSSTSNRKLRNTLSVHLDSNNNNNNNNNSNQRVSNLNPTSFASKSNMPNNSSHSSKNIIGSSATQNNGNSSSNNNNNNSSFLSKQIMVNNFSEEVNLASPSFSNGVSNISYNPLQVQQYQEQQQQQSQQQRRGVIVPQHKQSRSEVDVKKLQNYMAPSQQQQQQPQHIQLEPQYLQHRPSQIQQQQHQLQGVASAASSTHHSRNPSTSQPPSPYKGSSTPVQPIGLNTSNYLISRKASITSISNSNSARPQQQLQQQVTPAQGVSSSAAVAVTASPQYFQQQLLQQSQLQNKQPNTPNSSYQSLVKASRSDQRTGKQAQQQLLHMVGTGQVSAMNSSETMSNPSQPTEEEIPRNLPSCSAKSCFHYHYVIGKGGFGKVWKVEHRKTRQLFAMKEMSKSLVITKKSVNSVMNERTLLSQLKNPFLVNMFYAFHDRETLHLVMDLMPGGDLRYHIGRQRRFSEEQTRFFVACIFMGLEYLHNNNIIHRDIKPENLVLDSSGYVRITDLGIAREWKLDNANDTSGTPGYMAPEVMCRQPHTFAVDYFALGVLAYEFMLGRRPYLGRSRKEIRDQILAKRVQIKKHEIPDGWSLEAADFINRLIERKPSNRLGINGPAEVKAHPWIKNYPWQKLIKKQIPAPFVPANDDNFDQKQQISLEDEQNSELLMQNAMLLKRPSVQSLFNGYNFDCATIGNILNQESSSALTLQQPIQYDVKAATGSAMHNGTGLSEMSVLMPQQQQQLLLQSQQQYKVQQPKIVDLNLMNQTGKLSSASISPAVQRPSALSNGVEFSGHSSFTSYQNPFSQRSNSNVMISNTKEVVSNGYTSSKQQQSQMLLQQQQEYSIRSGLKGQYPPSNSNSLNSSRNYSNSLNQSHSQNNRSDKENFMPSRYAYEERY